MGMRNEAATPSVIGSVAILATAVAAVAGGMLWLVAELPFDEGVKGAEAVIALPAKIQMAVCADPQVPATDKPPVCQYMPTTTTVPRSATTP
jgi:hypothetical protein